MYAIKYWESLIKRDLGSERVNASDDADDAVERQKLGVNKERTTVALKGFIWSISHIITTCY